ncbi:YceI family protein [Aquimarina megaterium]|uniref:YceI family protein n=1 Tax=Aquimarina megaterium TaxID=1443666 RepID=UPI00046EBB3F|nr:YceI family protein [Aquimarina megaterium]
MKRVSIILFLLIFSSCKNDKNNIKTEKEKEVIELSNTDVTYTINTEQSIIKWEGFTPIAGDGHNGTIKLSSGLVQLKNNDLKSGNFIIDMNTIENSDIEDEKEKGELVEHLKNSDFFDVKKFPESKFEITNVIKDDGKTFLEGNFTMKGKINNIKIPISINKSKDELTIVSNTFNIDRTKWGIIYDSGSFFKDLGDHLIKDNIQIEFNLKGYLK